VRLLSLEHDTLSHARRFDRSKARLLSIAWGPPSPRSSAAKPTADGAEDESEEDDDEWTDEWIVTGGSDSALRKWDVRTGRVLEKMGTEKVRGERTLVWTVGVIGYVNYSN
jgi:U3 small nucleolar RNA-associated protein 4